MDLLKNVSGVGSAELAASAGSLMVRAPAEATGAGITFRFDGDARDWSAFQSLGFTLRANGAHRLRLHVTHGQGAWTMFLVPLPGLTNRVVIPFAELRERAHNTGYAGYSRFGGGPHPVALDDVHTFSLTFNQAAPEDKELTASDFRLAADVPEPAVLGPETLIDAWGQWAGLRGEPRSEAEIRAAWADEDATAYDGFPGHTTRYGGDAATPPGEATGFFRLSQTEGRWHLADPDGGAFFSLGCDCVRPFSEGPVGGREFLFADLSGSEPEGSRARERRSGGGPWADFYNANLRRRHADRGQAWRESWSIQTVARLRSWGFNTIANWSDADLTRRGLMPYTTNVTALNAMCGHLPDVYAPDFAARVRALVEPEVVPYRDDRMLVGFFVGNEPVWTFGGHRHPFNDVFTSEEYPHTRERAVAYVREAYGDDLARVNQAWNSRLVGWDDLSRADAGGVPDVRLGTDALKRDAHEFMGGVLGAFYETCCREIRAVDPNHLLLGGRFYAPDLADPYLRACRPFDVFSFNRYNWDGNALAIARIGELTGLPVLIGEFHYGVEGRGLTASLVATRSQDDRGLAYRHFVEGLAALPSVVGTHWFQWVDQPVTGRFDGERYNIGLVDVTDVPYEPFLAHVRETHARVYDLRRGTAVPYVFPHPRPSAW